MRRGPYWDILAGVVLLICRHACETPDDATPWLCPPCPCPINISRSITASQRMQERAAKQALYDPKNIIANNVQHMPRNAYDRYKLALTGKVREIGFRSRLTRHHSIHREHFVSQGLLVALEPLSLLQLLLLFIPQDLPPLPPPPPLLKLPPSRATPASLA